VPRRPHRIRNLVRGALAIAFVIAAAGPSAGPVSAADAATMEARILLGGHARLGSWLAIEVELANDGPSLTGELRLAGGAQGRTRFGTVVDLPTGSRKTYLLYAQPPAFGRDVEIALFEAERRVASTTVAYQIHDANRLVVGIVAERPQGIAGGMDLIPDQNRVVPLVVALSPADLPERVEAWGPIDRLIWQDVDSSRLSTAQIDALRGWLAGGGRLVIVGGTAGPGSLSAFPDSILPYRPNGTTEVAPASLSALVGDPPAIAADVPALSGDLIEGRPLASVGQRVVAAERPYGAGAVSLIGFDPTVSWIGESKAASGLWRRVLPPRAAGGLVLGDDSQLVSAVSQLPALALPPVGGLLALLGAYIVLIGPVNYLILRRLDRRELAWITMPVLIAVFAVAAYGFGAQLRGSDVIVNEVAIVRGSPGTPDGRAQVYLGVFSPSRGTYQVRIPGGALLSTPISGDFFGGDGSGASLDVLQGDPARVRDLAVGFGSLRAIRAETAVELPLIEARLAVIDGRLSGTVRNTSEQPLEKAAVVLGSTVALLDDIAPGAVAVVDVDVSTTGFLGQSLSDLLVGQAFFRDPSGQGPETMRNYVRRSIIDQLTFDPMFGTTNQLPAEGPVILAWGTTHVLDVRIEGQDPRRTGTVLYYLPTPLEVRGRMTFRADLMRSTVVATDALFFSKDPYSLNFGRGSATISYRPVTFDGSLTVSRLVLNLAWPGDSGPGGSPTEIEALDEIPPPCDPDESVDCANAVFDGMPEIEVREVGQDGEWRRLPHLSSGLRYVLKDPARFVDPGSGSVLVRFVNEVSEGVGFPFSVELEGSVR
jgi:hypothetical protein